MVVGDNEAFRYRSSSYITEFFQRCGQSFVHYNETRWRWAHERLKELNEEPSSSPDLPSDQIVRVITELLDSDDFDRAKKDREAALLELNRLLGKQALNAYFGSDGYCYLRNKGTGAVSAAPQHPRPLSPEEIEQRSRLEAFLDSATEDDLTEKLLVPFFQRLGFHRVSASGHKDKLLEYGKDLWTKLQLPTGHWIYFAIQVKRQKLDAKAGAGDTNTATVLSQALMALDHEIFDPDINRDVLIDHIYIISAGEITKAAKNWLGGKLDASKRRQILFMDRAEILDHAAKILLDLKLEEPPPPFEPDDEPF